MRTIVISSFHVLISRNIFSTPVLTLLVENGVRVVILAPKHKLEYFQKKFAGEGVVIEGIDAYTFSTNPIGLFFKRLSRTMLSTDTVRIRMQYKRDVEHKYLTFLLFVLPSRLVGKFHIGRRFVRWLDYTLAPKKGFFGPIFDRYKPDLVVGTDVNNENDVALLQDARRRGLCTFGIVRSWDNLTNYLMRIVPDRLSVANEIMKMQAVTYHDVLPEQVRVVGIPHHDKYTKGPTMERDAFFRTIGADPNKKLLLYVPVADYRIKTNDIDPFVIHELAKLPYTTIVRFPPAAGVSIDDRPPAPNIIFDHPGIAFRGKGDSEMSEADDERLINTLAYCDVMVSGPGTMNIDAAIFDKPIILINFYPSPRPPLEQIREYRYSHILPILASGGTRMAHSLAELSALLERYLGDPSLEAAGRRRIVEEQCYRLDGRSSERLAHYLMEVMSKP